MRCVLPLLASSVLALPAAGPAATPSPPAPTSQVIRVSLDGKRTAIVSPDGSVLAGSPDGRAIAFATKDGLWLTNGAPASNRLLVTDFGDLRGPLDVAWSGDGRRLAIGPCVSTRCTGHVFVVDARTGSKTMLPFAAYSPSLSPDGRRIALTTAAGRSVIATVEGRVLVRLGQAEQVRFAPRGRLLAYVNGLGSICVMRDDGTKRRCLAPGTRPVWSPRAIRLAFQTSPDLGFTWRFAVANVTGPPHVQPMSPWFQFPPDPAETDRNGGLSWSPSGRVLAYGSGDLHVVPGRTLPPAGSGFCSASATAFTRSDEIVYSSECFNPFPPSSLVTAARVTETPRP